MSTVRHSAKVTCTLLVVAAAACFVFRVCMSAKQDYFVVVRAFILTRAELGGIHLSLIRCAFFGVLLAGGVNAVLTDRSSFTIIAALWVPILMIGALALVFIPGLGFANIHLFWLICYVVMVLGAWFSAMKTNKLCSRKTKKQKATDNADAQVEAAEDSESQTGVPADRIDVVIAKLTTVVSFVLLGAVIAGAVVYAIHNRNLISGSDDITPVVSSIRYHAALELLDTGEYKEALDEFKQLGDYEDSAAMAAECEDLLYYATYQEAEELMSQGRYDEAKSAFHRIYHYRDSADRIAKCNDLQYGPRYEEALMLKERGQYEEALAIFEQLRGTGYKNVTDEIKKCKTSLKASLSGTWYGSEGSVLTLKEDLTCSYVDGGGPSGEGTWDVVDNRLIVHTNALSYDIYGTLKNGYSTSSILIQADSSNWIDESFTKE